MPIQFRCPHCSRMLGVARRKAGAQVRCPRCGRPATVPGGEESGPFDDLDAPVSAPARPAPSGVGIVPAPAPAKPAAREQPLFEADDLDAILGVKRPEPAFELDDPADGPRPVSGADAGSLADGHGLLTLSRSGATALGAVMLVLLVLAFALGVLVGARW